MRWSFWKQSVGLKSPIFYDEEVCVEIKLDSMDRYFFSFSYRLSVEDSLRAEGKN